MNIRGAVTGIEAVNVAVENRTRRVGEFTNLEPCDGVQYLMQTGWDQQTVDETKDTGTRAPAETIHSPPAWIACCTGGQT